MNKKWLLLLMLLPVCGAVFCQQTPKDSSSIEYQEKESDAAPIKGNLTLKQKDSAARTLSPSEGEALVYILRPTSFGALIRMPVECDQIRIGSTKAGNYLYARLAPGSHTFLSIAENNSSFDLTLEAGKTYYIKQQVKMGFMYAETGLKLVEDKEGLKELKKCKLSKDNAASK